MDKMKQQYVGARYVPAFFEYNNGEWARGYSYERLTIVLYNNNSYTSKKFVPAKVGNPADNSDYWVLTSNYDAYQKTQDEKIQANADAISTETTARKNTDNTLVNNVSLTNENHVYTLKQTKGSAESEVGTIEVPEIPVAISNVTDTVTNNDTSGYDYHAVSEKKTDSSEADIGKLYVAQKQITGITANSKGGLDIKTVDQSGQENTSNIVPALKIPASDAEVDYATNAYIIRSFDETKTVTWNESTTDRYIDFDLTSYISSTTLTSNNFATGMINVRVVTIDDARTGYQTAQVFRDADTGKFAVRVNFDNTASTGTEHTYEVTADLVLFWGL